MFQFKSNKCKTCNGSGNVKARRLNCGGRGKVGTNHYEQKCPYCTGGKIEQRCSSCSGTGMVDK